ncbi:MAG: low temperature requirement protein A, partial [Dermatophilaceae bacterium]
SIGVGVTELPVSWPIVVGSVLGLGVAAALWWVYFDLTSRMAEHALTRARGEARNRLGRDGYSYLHLPMMVGVILVALGLKKVLGYVGGEDGHDLGDPVKGVPGVSLYVGVAVYLLAHVAFKYRLVGLVRPERAVTAAVLIALSPLVSLVPALAALAVVALVLAALVGYETAHYAELRDQVRHSGPDHESSPAGG